MNSNRLSIGWLCMLLVFAVDAQAGNATRVPMKLCGWFSNPTPANVWLLDRHASWTIATQGGMQADGDWPRFKPSQWVKTNMNYGYGCACLSVVANPRTHEVSRIRSAHAQSLRTCEKDPALKRRPE